MDESLDRLRPGDAALARLLLESGAEPNDNDSLYHSLDPADDACTRLLLEHGAQVTGTNALWHALDYDRPERVRLLLEHGGDPNESPEWPALHHAVIRGRAPDVMRLLVEYGADVAPDATAPGALRISTRSGAGATTWRTRCESSVRPRRLRLQISP